MGKVKNVLVLMCDHHRFDALGCLGNPLAHTPNLDKLASQSIRFDNCYSQSPVCAPARHSLATGRYAHAQGVITNGHKPHPGMVTIAHALQPLGYRRMNMGHMHWTDLEMDNGYEPWLTHRIWHDAMPEPVQRRYEWEAQSITRRTTGGPSPRTREQYSGYYVAKHAIEQMADAVGKGEPFLCWAAFSEPHPPFYPPKDTYQMFDLSAIRLPAQAPAEAAPPHELILRKRKEWAHLTELELRQMIAGYYGLVHLVDQYIGSVLEALDRLGVRDETLVIWTVDHGDLMWEHELFLKFCMYEGAVHVPLLMSVPGLQPGARDELVEHIDLFPSICELVGAECPDTVQGRSLVPLLGTGPAPDDWRDAVFSQIGTLQMIRTRDWKLNVYNGAPGELYDMRNDPDEFDNRIAAPDCADQVKVLLGRLREWEKANAAAATAAAPHG
ncbi:MAG: sulfatase-like hydrolase/transferase [Kiritimatiellae bacterium]|nr:sulfatase-like hydrolase/transferase [Kiritimatiellia bacterium]